MTSLWTLVRMYLTSQVAVLPAPSAPPPPAWAVYHHGYHWLVDDCAGGAYSDRVDEAKWFDSPDQATDALSHNNLLHPSSPDPITPASVTRSGFMIVRVQ